MMGKGFELWLGLERRLPVGNRATSTVCRARVTRLTDLLKDMSIDTEEVIPHYHATLLG